MRGFHEYKFEMGEQEDSLWEQYLNVLYPSPQEFERIKNREVLDVLAEHGDVPGASRDVQHWMYFKTRNSRALFKEAVVREGYRIESESDLEDGELPFGISVIRNQSVEQDSIDTTVGELVKLTEQFDGEYDGWETQVVMQ
jgi:regulator of RNase E activity RraB